MGKRKLAVPVAKGQTYTVPIHGMGSNGEGIGRVEGFTVFVPFALPGETVQAKVDVVKKNYATATIETIEVASPHRIEPRCSVYGTCGGCQLQHVSYEEQLALKTQKVKDVIERIAGDDPNLVRPALGPANPWQYRNKMQMPVGSSNGELAMGFYARGSHDIVTYVDCHIQSEANNEMAKVCYSIMKDTGIAPYDEVRETGVVRHIIGRVANEGKENEEWMLIIVAATKQLPEQDTWVTRLTEAFPKLKSIVLNYNSKKTNVIMGRKNTLLWGNEYINDSIEELDFRLSAHSFFQVNPRQTEVLYDEALRFAALTGEETVIDAYCGTGTISLCLARQAKEVIGIEIVEPAIIDARTNAKRNGFTNATFMVADAAEAMPTLYKDGVRPDVIVFDPIRAGCKEPVLYAAAAMAPKRIVYVSCNPASMARDIAILKEKGYRLEAVQPVDMFPMTAHVEAVCLLSRKDK